MNFRGGAWSVFPALEEGKNLVGKVEAVGAGRMELGGVGKGTEGMFPGGNRGKNTVGQGFLLLLTGNQKGSGDGVE